MFLRTMSIIRYHKANGPTCLTGGTGVPPVFPEAAHGRDAHATVYYLWPLA